MEDGRASGASHLAVTTDERMFRVDGRRVQLRRTATDVRVACRRQRWTVRVEREETVLYSWRSSGHASRNIVVVVVLPFIELQRSGNGVVRYPDLTSPAPLCSAAPRRCRPMRVVVVVWLSSTVVSKGSIDRKLRRRVASEQWSGRNGVRGDGEGGNFPTHR